MATEKSTDEALDLLIKCFEPLLKFRQCQALAMTVNQDLI